MPLARIVTRFPQSSLAAADYFRSRGYTVEVVDPGDFRVTPAVVELKLDKCAPDEALLRAQGALDEIEAAGTGSKATTQSEAGEASRAEVPEEQPEVLAYDIAGRPVLFAERRKTPSSFRGALVSLLRRAWNDTGSRLPDALHALGIAVPTKKRRSRKIRKVAPTRPGVVTQIPTRTTVAADHLARAAAEREAAERENRTHIAAREAEERERIRLQQESEAATERERQRTAAAAREAEMVRQREQERVAALRAAEERSRRQREAEAATERERLRIVGETELARQRQREEQRQAAVVAAEEQRLARAAAELVRRERERAMAESEKLSAERERLFSAAKSAYETSQISRRLQASPPVPAQAQSYPNHAYRRRQTDIPPQAWERRLNPVHESEWKKAFAAAGVVAILVTTGILAFNNRRPAEPLSPEQLNRSQIVDQQTPFGSATINPAVAAVPQPSKAMPTVVPAVQKPTPARPPVNHAAKSPRRSSVSLRRSPPEEEQVAEDQVVVRHFQQPQSVLKTAASAGGGIKQISDLH